MNDLRFLLARSLLTGGAILLAGCGSTPAPQEPKTAPTTTADTAAVATDAPPGKPDDTVAAPKSKEGPGGFPLPVDAEKDEQKSAGPIAVFVVPRGKGSALEEMHAILAAEGWKIDSEEASPSNAAMRLTVSKNGDTFKVSVTGDETKAAIIVTPPKGKGAVAQ